MLQLPGIYVVADGMGGHQAGDVASRLTIEAIAALLADGVPDVATIGRVVEEANRSVRAHAAASGTLGMGSTLVGAFLVRNADEDSIVVVNVGDSRCYVMNDGILRQLTKDHSHVQELVDSGVISAADAATHPERNVVTRAIGIEDAVAGDFFVVPPAPQVRLLLCSDGVSGELSFSRIEQLLATTTDPAEASAALIAAVLEGRAADNASAIVVDVHRSQPPVDVLDSSDITGPRPLRPPIPETPAVVSISAVPGVSDLGDAAPSAMEHEQVGLALQLIAEVPSAATPTSTSPDENILIDGVPD